jgi:hypothetical protein
VTEVYNRIMVTHLLMDSAKPNRITTWKVIGKNGWIMVEDER